LDPKIHYVILSILYHLVKGAAAASVHHLATLHNLTQTAASLAVSARRLEAIKEVLLIQLAGITNSAVLHGLGGGGALHGGSVSVGVLDLNGAASHDAVDGAVSD